MGRFIIALTAVACVCLIGAYAIGPMPTLAIPTTVFVSLTTLLIFRYLIAQKDPKFFVTFYLATMAFKILIFGAYVFVMAKLDKTTVIINVVYFMIVYFLTLVTEIGFLYYAKRQS